MKLQIIPITLAEANVFVRSYHRHHGPVTGHMFSIAACMDINEVIGCVIVGRPVSRGLDDGWTLEVTRLVTKPNYPNVCSALYGAAWRAARALGYRKLVTYTLASESGTSVKAAGWKAVAEVKGRSWHCESRPRVDKHPTQDKIRFEVTV